MRKLVLSLIIVGVLLAGCSGTSSKKAESIVKDLYQAAFNKEFSEVDSLLIHLPEYDRYAEEFQEDLYDTVADLGGMNHLKIDTPNEKLINQELINGLNNEFDDNWKMVCVKMDENYFMVWILQEIDGDLYIIDGEDFNGDELFISDDSK